MNLCFFDTPVTMPNGEAFFATGECEYGVSVEHDMGSWRREIVLEPDQYRVTLELVSQDDDSRPPIRVEVPVSSPLWARIEGWNWDRWIDDVCEESWS